MTLSGLTHACFFLPLCLLDLSSYSSDVINEALLITHHPNPLRVWALICLIVSKPGLP